MMFIYRLNKFSNPLKESVDDLINEQQPISTTTVSRKGHIQEIKFNIDKKSEENIHQAIKFHNERMSQIHTELLPLGNAPVLENTAFYPKDYDFPEKVRFFHKIDEKRLTVTFKQKDLSRLWMKKHKLGPDGFFQLSLQLAFSQMHGHPVSVYEACSTAAFKHGRTETIRTATKESKNLQQAFRKVKHRYKKLIVIFSSIKNAHKL